ncbi:Crp/Fnr family transcriptional regulator [Salaquimonas pukyongi]|uniref:Crp/Fnr family transcriptional regulator n=1 Tax=Salaquimonas pukyongi TaxID=2712698 RepID=UPI00096BBBD7|nr:cyclic nucleotide-binding domain-containing protein [Salaquimonas pukyongi]
MNLFENPVFLTLLVAGVFAIGGLFARRALSMRLFLLGAGIAAALAAWFSQSMALAAIAGAAIAVNLFRIYEIHNTSRRIRHIRHYGYNVSDLRKYMRPASFSAGQTIFEKGDPADRLYLVDEGTVAIDNGAKVEKDGLLGEVGLFTRSASRSMGARALGDVKLRMLGAEEVSRLCLDDPEFAYALAQIMATRMSENLQQLDKD